jgi:hypothetical protein
MRVERVIWKVLRRVKGVYAVMFCISAAKLNAFNFGFQKEEKKKQLKYSCNVKNGINEQRK